MTDRNPDDYDFEIILDYPLYCLAGNPGAIHLIDVHNVKIFMVWTDLDAAQTFIERNRDHLFRHGYGNTEPLEISDECGFIELCRLIQERDGVTEIAFDMTHPCQTYRRQMGINELLVWRKNHPPAC